MPGELAPHAVERREDDRVGRVVDDEVDAGQVLERADVAALASDDAALHVVGRQLHDGDGRLGGVAGRQALHRDRQDRAHAALGLALGLVLDLAQDARLLVARVVLDLLEQRAARLPRAEPGDALERRRVLGARAPSRAPARAPGRARARRARTARRSRSCARWSSERSSARHCSSRRTSSASRASSSAPKSRGVGDGAAVRVGRVRSEDDRRRDQASSQDDRRDDEVHLRDPFSPTRRAAPARDRLAVYVRESPGRAGGSISDVTAARTRGGP